MSNPHSLHLLAVGDTPGDARQLRLAMQRIGLAVELHFVGDALEALQFLRRQGDRFLRAPRPDLVLLDTDMPGQDGLAFLATIKQDEHLRAIPVVIMTTSEIEADVRAAYRTGAAGYILKPADIDEFAAAIDKLVQYWFGRMRLPENCETRTGLYGQ